MSSASKDLQSSVSSNKHGTRQISLRSCRNLCRDESLKINISISLLSVDSLTEKQSKVPVFSKLYFLLTFTSFINFCKHLGVFFCFCFCEYDSSFTVNTYPHISRTHTDLQKVSVCTNTLETSTPQQTCKLMYNDVKLSYLGAWIWYVVWIWYIVWIWCVTKKQPSLRTVIWSIQCTSIMFSLFNMAIKRLKTFLSVCVLHFSLASCRTHHRLNNVDVKSGRFCSDTRLHIYL